METGIDKFKKKIKSVNDLPTLPTVAMEVMKLVNDPESSMMDIVDVIQQDPALTTKILKISNSAFYGMRQRIDSVNRALVVLGMSEINNLVTSISIFNTFPIDPELVTFDREKFWLHCAVTGEIAKAISVKLGMKIYSEVFTAGLLHDIGKIIFDHLFHDEFSEALEISYFDKEPLYDAEKKVFETNHMQVGAFIGETWKLPKNLIDVMLYHHTPKKAQNNRIIVAIISLANQLSKASDSSFSGEELNLCITETDAWKIIQNEIPNIEEIDIERFTFELAELVENAKNFINNAK